MKKSIRTMVVFAAVSAAMILFAPGCRGDGGDDSGSEWEPGGDDYTSGWGQSCRSDQDCNQPDKCIKIVSDDYGFCSPPCSSSQVRQLDEYDTACTDEFGGDEYCGIRIGSVNYCTVYCESDADCRDGTVCEMGMVWDTYQYSCTGKPGPDQNDSSPVLSSSCETEKAKCREFCGRIYDYGKYVFDDMTESDCLEDCAENYWDLSC